MASEKTVLLENDDSPSQSPEKWDDCKENALKYTNLAGMFLHLVMAATILWVSYQNDPDGVQMNFYRTHLLAKESYNRTTDKFYQERLYPVYTMDNSSDKVELSLTWLATSFCLMSFFAHFIIVVDMVCVNKFYRTSIDSCCQPLRWIEYVGSASVMSIVLSYLSGVRSFELMLCIFGLVATTMLFGFLTEVVSEPQNESTWKPIRRLEIFPKQIYM